MMEKEQYLKLRQEGSIELLYEYYKDHFIDKHTFLKPDEFFQTIVQWPPVNDVFKTVVSYYDAKFEIMKIEDVNTHQTLKVY